MAGYHISHLVSERVEMGTVVPEYVELEGWRGYLFVSYPCSCVRILSSFPILGRVEECVGG